MVITQTPFRMSFFGGGTDIPVFFNKYGGSVLSSTFDKYCYVTVRHLPPFFDYHTEICYSKLERVVDIETIKHPAVRNAMKMLDMYDIRMTYEADLPARTGLGTSSSFAVGLLNSFYALKGKYVCKQQLAKDAIYLERVLCNEAGGWQDQIAASFGGLNRIDFLNDDFEIKPVIISPERKRELNDNLMLFFTGFTRSSASVQVQTLTNINNKISELKEMSELVNAAEKILTDKTQSIDEIGILLNYSWRLKKSTSSAISTSNIDVLYEKGIKAGALGGKLLGAGGGGFLLFYVQPEYQENVLKKLSDLMFIPFKFEEMGTRVIYYSPETYSIKDK